MENESQFKNQENAVIKIWDKRYSETETYRKQKVKDGSVFDFFEKYNDEVKAGPSLDLGCGNGRHLRHMARMGLDTYGIDISSESLKQLKEDFKEEDLMANIQQSSFYNLPYKDEKFNSIVSHNSLQHNDWDGAKKSFAEVGRVLKDSGLFSLTVISTNCDRPQQVNDISSKEEGTTFIPYEGRKAGIKVHHYSEEELEELAQENGLKIIEKREYVREVTDPYDNKKVQKGHWIVVFRKNKDNQHSA